MKKQIILSTLVLAAVTSYSSINLAEGAGGGCQLYVDANNDGKFAKDELACTSFLTAKIPLILSSSDPSNSDLSKKQVIMAPNHCRYTRELLNQMEKEFAQTGHYDSVRSSIKRYEAHCGSARIPIKFNEQLSKKVMFNFDRQGKAVIDLKDITSGTDWASFDIDPRVSPSVLAKIQSYDPSANFDDSTDSIGRDIYVGTNPKDPTSVNTQNRCKLAEVGDRGYLVIHCPKVYDPEGHQIVSGDLVFFAEPNSEKIADGTQSGYPSVVGMVKAINPIEADYMTSITVETMMPTKDYQILLNNQNAAAAAANK